MNGGQRDRMYAVLIPLVKTESGDALLLEVRSEKVRQPGEVCFPGGKSERGENVTETAVRETCEELGLRPEDIEIISEREPLIMGDGREIHPVEARLCIDGTKGLRLSEDEVTEVFLLPLEWLKENPPVHYDLSAMTDDELPDKLLRYLSHYGSYRDHGETDWLEYEGHGIWGLTARILKSYRHETSIYTTDISDARWIAYDIPGNIGWITYLAMLAKMIRDKEYGSAAVSAAPAVLMITGIAELISERIEGLDRELPKDRLYRGFGALTLGGITGIAAAAAAKSDSKIRAAMGTGAALCAVFAGLLLRGYKIKE